MWNRIRLSALATLLFLLGLAGIWVLFEGTNPLGGVEIGLGSDAIMTRAAQLADSLGLDRTGSIATVSMRPDKQVLSAVYARHGLARGNELLRMTVPGYLWRVNWAKPSEDLVVRGGSSSSSEGEQGMGPPPGLMGMVFDLRGVLIGFNANIADSIPLPSLVADSARLLADAFLSHSAPQIRSLADLTFKEEKRFEIPRSGRTDYEYRWEGTDTLLDRRVAASVRVAGTHVVSLSVTEAVPTVPSGKGAGTYFEIGALILVILLVITMIIVAIRRIRAYEIGWRTAIVIGGLGAVLFALDMYYSMGRGLDIRAAVSLMVAPLFLGGFMTLAWAVAESAGREVWKEKFVPIDLITRGHLLDSRVAEGVLVGLAGGALAAVVWCCGAWSLERAIPLGFSAEPSRLGEYLTRPAPAIMLLAHDSVSPIFVLSGLLLFPLAILRRRISSAWVLTGLGALFVVLSGKPSAEPYLAGALIEWVSMTVVVCVLVRRNILAAYTALVAAPALSALPVFLRSGDAALFFSGESVVLLFGAAVVVAWIGLLTKDRVTDLEAITPAFALHISERERLQQELRIARDVQVSLLPKTTPSIRGYDIAARCVPAQEVGGDYYDFVLLDGTRLGIVIGDVSGKGTEGAFYMTLTKGFLKAVVRAFHSPAAVLTQANELFCENVSRGNFISMVYASMEVEGAKVTFARAGHNPVILYRARSRGAEFFQPKGIALGLEPGEVFARTIEEVSVTLEAGDVLVLYTDGFGEAMNRGREEFGEARLQESIIRLAGGSSEEILSGILKDVRAFVGRAEQHDDMTMVVVKKT